MASSIDEISLDYWDENGQQLIKQLDKEVLSRGSWATILFLYSEWDKKSSAWGPVKARIERYQKRNGEYRSQSRFKFTSAKQIRQIQAVFERWLLEQSLGEDEE